MAIALSALTMPALAADAPFPNRPVRMLIPYPAGGGLDLPGRAVAQKFADATGQQMVIDNRGGAGGLIAGEIVAKSTPDGYTLLLASNGQISIAPALYAKLPYHPLNDFVPITHFVDTPMVLFVNSQYPVQSVADLIAAAKAKPGTIGCALSGVGGVSHLTLELFKLKAGLNLTHIPYKGGAGPATLAVLGGEVAATMLTVASFIPHVKGGKAKVLAVVAPKRVSQLPDTPTMAESGFPELLLGSWQGVSVPAGTSRAIVNRLYTAIIKTMNDPETVKRLASGGAEVVTSKSPAEFAAFLQTQTEFWAKLVKQTGAVAE